MFGEKSVRAKIRGSGRCSLLVLPRRVFILNVFILHLAMQASRAPPNHDRAVRASVLDVYLLYEDWCPVAVHNGIKASITCLLSQHGRIEPLPRGGARQARTRMTDVP